MNRNRFRRPELPDPGNNPSKRAPLCCHEGGLHRFEAVLFLSLAVAVGLALSNLAGELNRFARHLPEFATVVAELFRSAVLV